SMVRHHYGLSGAADVRAVGIFHDPRDTPQRWKHLGGFRRRPEKLTIRWQRFFELDDGQPPQRAMRINELLSPPLFALPPDRASLARLNLRRGRALGLPAGADVAQAMGCAPLPDAKLALGALHAGDRERLLRATPLWFYLLREAATAGKGARLGPVGSRIVAEVLAGLLEADPSSYLRQAPAWTPSLPRADEHDFTIADLVRFTEGTPPPKAPRAPTEKPA
ncbi:MAG: hypothetical protein ACRDMZ_24575, partial [Solirubrobacteraceae bacterium]